jgi:hypothetical protein
MSEFHHTPDGRVYVRTDTAAYSDTAADFAADFGVTLPVLPVGVVERIYVPGARHALIDAKGNQVDTGSVSWDIGDAAIAAVGKALAAQAARIAASLPLPSRARQLADARYAAETGGITWNGHPVSTTREAQAQITGAYALSMTPSWPAGGILWKWGDGSFSTLSAANVQEMAIAVASHVQTCFAVEAVKLADTSDPAAGWPA